MSLCVKKVLQQRSNSTGDLTTLVWTVSDWDQMVFVSWFIITISGLFQNTNEYANEAGVSPHQLLLVVLLTNLRILCVIGCHAVTVLWYPLPSLPVIVCEDQLFNEFVSWEWVRGHLQVCSQWSSMVATMNRRNNYSKENLRLEKKKFKTDLTNQISDANPKDISNT